MTPLFGHEPALAAFCTALSAGRLPHAWLVAGPRGIGKATFARHAARNLLTTDFDDNQNSARDQSEHLLESGSHPDYRFVEREAWTKNGELIPKHERTPSNDLGRNIRVVQIRWLEHFLAIRPSLSSYRAIIVDSADDLEAGAANALLKMLEEPPARAVFLLVSHFPDRLLPTIRSRCRLLRLKPLDDDAMTSALRAALPDDSQAEIAAMVRGGQGAPGRAIAQRGLDLDTLDAAMAALIREGDPTNAARSVLAQSLSLKAAQPRYEAFLARAPAAIAAATRERRGPALADALALWERAVALAGAARRLSLDPTSTVFELAGMLAALAPVEGKRAA